MAWLELAASSIRSRPHKLSILCRLARMLGLGSMTSAVRPFSSFMAFGVGQGLSPFYTRRVVCENERGSAARLPSHYLCPLAQGRVALNHVVQGRHHFRIELGAGTVADVGHDFRIRPRLLVRALVQQRVE